MADRGFGTVLQYLHRIASADGRDGPTDGELLARFTRSREESSFATLVGRHGPMVFRVCRNLLHDAHDCEDAFRATFLVLVRKAKSLNSSRSLGNWLYG